MTKLNETTKVRPSELLAAAAAIAAGTQAYGEVIMFINPNEGEPGHFDWELLFGNSSPSQWLDITRPSTDQGGLVGPSSIGQLLSGVPPYPGVVFNSTGGGASVAYTYVYYYYLTRAFVGGELIGAASAPFSSGSTHAAGLPGWQYVPPRIISYFFEDEGSYMGVRFTDVDGYHYGWIGVQPARISVGMPPVPVLDFDAFAWGYETEPGVPIIAGIPAPGTLAALAFGAVVTRRKRKD